MAPVGTPLPMTHVLLPVTALVVALAGLALAFTPVGWGWGVPISLVALGLAGPAWDRSRGEKAHVLGWAAILAALSALLIHLLVYIEILALRD